MGWRDGVYYYSSAVLKTIAWNYANLYDGLEFRGNLITNPFLLAEFKADFDIALRNIGRGKWKGEPSEFKYYRNYGRLQRIIIADILGVDDNELKRLGFYDIPRLRGYSYYLMKCFLNNGMEMSNGE